MCLNAGEVSKYTHILSLRPQYSLDSFSFRTILSVAALVSTNTQKVMQQVLNENRQEGEKQVAFCTLKINLELI